MTMIASFLGGSATAVASKQLSTTTSHHRRGVIMAKASKVSNEGLSLKSENKEEGGSGRRDLVFAAAAAAVCSIAKVAAAGEPKRGTAEAKKEYAPVCVTMPTARICHK